MRHFAAGGISRSHPSRRRRREAFAAGRRRGRENRRPRFPEPSPTTSGIPRAFERGNARMPLENLEESSRLARLFDMTDPKLATAGANESPILAIAIVLAAIAALYALVALGAPPAY
jgi:hypothetical protein